MSWNYHDFVFKPSLVGVTTTSTMGYIISVISVLVVTFIKVQLHRLAAVADSFRSGGVGGFELGLLHDIKSVFVCFLLLFKNYKIYY